jgi:calcineurin-like phosphoesterase family protein
VIPEIWFTADAHLGHRRIPELAGRPFADSDEMDAAIVDAWNQMIRPHDMVWCLGDMAMGDMDRSLALLHQLHGRKHLISGNHDRTFAGYGHRDPKMIDYWVARYRAAGFVAVHTSRNFQLHPRKSVHVQIPLGFGLEPVLLSHFPYEGDTQGSDRFREFRPRRPRGKPAPVLVHGHTHSGERVGDRMVHVGMDAWDCVPAHIDEVRELVRGLS